MKIIFIILCPESYDPENSVFPLQQRESEVWGLLSPWNSRSNSYGVGSLSLAL